MAVQLPWFQRIGFAEANPNLAGIEAGQDIAKNAYQMPINAANAQYAQSNADIQNQLNQGALRFQPLSQQLSALNNKYSIAAILAAPGGKEFLRQFGHNVNSLGGQGALPYNKNYNPQTGADSEDSLLSSGGKGFNDWIKNLTGFDLGSMLPNFGGQDNSNAGNAQATMTAAAPVSPAVPGTEINTGNPVDNKTHIFHGGTARIDKIKKIGNQTYHQINGTWLPVVGGG